MQEIQAIKLKPKSGDSVFDHVVKSFAEVSGAYSTQMFDVDHVLLRAVGDCDSSIQVRHMFQLNDELILNEGIIESLNAIRITRVHRAFGSFGQGYKWEKIAVYDDNSPSTDNANEELITVVMENLQAAIHNVCGRGCHEEDCLAAIKLIALASTNLRIIRGKPISTHAANYQPPVNFSSIVSKCFSTSNVAYTGAYMGTQIPILASPFEVAHFLHTTLKGLI